MTDQRSGYPGDDPLEPLTIVFQQQLELFMVRRLSRGSTRLGRQVSRGQVGVYVQRRAKRLKSAIKQSRTLLDYGTHLRSTIDRSPSGSLPSSPKTLLRRHVNPKGDSILPG